MDGGTVYSNEPEVAADIRAFEGGLMKTLPLFRDQGLMVIIIIIVITSMDNRLLLY